MIVDTLLGHVTVAWSGRPWPQTARAPKFHPSNFQEGNVEFMRFSFAILFINHCMYHFGKIDLSLSKVFS